MQNWQISMLRGCKATCGLLDAKQRATHKLLWNEARAPHPSLKVVARWQGLLVAC
jgi:hypothetical protein